MLFNKSKGERSKIIFGRADHSVEHAKAEANRSTLESGVFKKGCMNAGVPETKRQASKWNNKKGAAYASRNFR